MVIAMMTAATSQPKAIQAPPSRIQMMFSSSDIRVLRDYGRVYGEPCPVIASKIRSLRPAAVDGACGDSHSRAMRFIHTADWQIGKPFRNFGEKESVLRQARLAAIEAIGRLAQQRGAPRMCWWRATSMTMRPPPRRPCWSRWSACGAFPDVTWHVIPGNHDHHRGNGLWDRASGHRPSANVHLHLTPEPATLGAEAVLFPAPLRRRSEANGPDRMDGRRPKAPPA